MSDMNANAYLNDAPREVPSPWGGRGTNGEVSVVKQTSYQERIEVECMEDPAMPDEMD